MERLTLEQLIDSGTEARVVLLVHLEALVESHDLFALLLQLLLQAVDAVLGGAVLLLHLHTPRTEGWGKGHKRGKDGG